MRYALGGLVVCIVGGVFVWLANSGTVSSPLSADALAHARTFAEHEPFLSTAGTSPENLREAVNALKSIQEGLATLQSNSREADLVRDALYPVPFLESLAFLEERRLAFVSSGTDDDQRAYDAATDAAIRAYRDDLSRFRTAFLEVVSEDAPRYVAGDAYINRQAILDALLTLERGIEETERKLRERRTCIAHRADCSPNLSESAPTPLEKAPARMRDVAEDVRLVHMEAGRDVSAMVEMKKGVCTMALPGAGFFARSMRDTAAVPLYLGDMTFVESKEQQSVPFYRYFAQRDIEYVPNYPLTHYSCPEFAAEFSRLLAALEPESAPDRALGTKNNSVRFDEVVRYVAHIERFIMNGAENGAPGAVNAATLFYVRSAFPAFFLAHNPSASGPHEQLFPPANIPAEDRPFVYFSTLPPSTRPDIVEGIRAFDVVHRPTL